MDGGLLAGTVSIPIKFAISHMRIFRGRNVSSRNSATVASWTKTHLTVPKFSTQPVPLWDRNKSSPHSALLPFLENTDCAGFRNPIIQGGNYAPLHVLVKLVPYPYY